MYENTTGAQNVAIGPQTLGTNSSGSYNTGVGYQTLYYNTTGHSNTAVGTQTLVKNTTGSANTGMGTLALAASTTGDFNTAYGFMSLYDNTTGERNTALGAQSLYRNTTGAGNTAFGKSALLTNTTGSNNTGLGDGALYSNTTGISNAASGVNALFYNTTGSYNTASGSSALLSNTTGYNNAALGYAALYNNTTGSGNTAFGKSAMQYTTTGSNNIGLGDGAMYRNTTGYNNVAIGASALFSNTTGANNTAIGVAAGYAATGTGNVFIGSGAGANATGNNKLYIDNSVTGTPLIYGDFSSNALTVNGTFTATGGVTTTDIYHTNGTKLLSLENGEVHLGPTSMIFTDSTISGNADIMSSTVGKVQIGKYATDSTTVVGSLSVQDPTAYAHAANKGYVDTLRKDARRYDSRSVALSAALTALPTNGGTGSHTCGVGAGVRGEYTAMALGCAADLANFELPAATPDFIKNASVNAGTSFLAHDDPDYTFKMGMSFNFGGSKSKSNASNFNTDFARELALVEQRNLRTNNKQAEAIKNVQKDNHQIRQDNRQMKRVNLKVLAENKNLQAQIDVLIASQADMLVMKEQLAQLTALIAGSEMVAVK